MEPQSTVCLFQVLVKEQQRAIKILLWCFATQMHAIMNMQLIKVNGLSIIIILESMLFYGTIEVMDYQQNQSLQNNQNRMVLKLQSFIKRHYLSQDYLGYMENLLEDR